jgi:hypothetical protein
MKQKVFAVLIGLIGLLSLGLLRTTETSAQIDYQMLTPTAAPMANLTFTSDMLPTAPLISDAILAPGCELTSAEAGVYRIECEEDTGTTGVPTIDGELLAQGCEVLNPEVGVFILDCGSDPVPPIPAAPAPLVRR